MENTSLETNWKIETLATFILEHYGWTWQKKHDGIFHFTRDGKTIYLVEKNLEDLVINKQMVSFYA